ncbi:MAG: hypothetical protein H0X34_10555 [Chthoniobacterales bacterium]|nr:hypothetical protein [Chthoniobacterales bacterium]
MDFQSDEVCDFHRFSEKRADIFQMRQQRLRSVVSFPTENLVPVSREIVKEILLLRRRLSAKGGQARFESRQLSRMRFELRMQTNEVRRQFHNAEGRDSEPARRE